LKILVIPDVHLKPWMFDRAKAIMDTGAAEKSTSGQKSDGIYPKDR
jgi:hypothetical protein